MALTAGEILVYDGTKWVTSNVGGAPVLARGVGIGSGAPAPTLVSGSNNTRGEIDFTTGSSPANQMVQVTFNPSTFYSVTPYVFLQLLDNVGGALGLNVGDRVNTGFNIYFQNAPAASATYHIYYWVVG